MARSVQYNFYVHPEKEKELKEFLDSFPKMVRSTFIKTAVLEAKNRNTGYQNMLVQPTPTVEEINELRVVSDFELDISEL